jgi:hypothetical protein
MTVQADRTWKTVLGIHDLWVRKYQRDPCLCLMDPDPTAVPIFSDTKDAKIIIFYSIFPVIYPQAHSLGSQIYFFDKIL